jgi:ABC-type transporter Mla subunit MlaD
MNLRLSKQARLIGPANFASFLHEIISMSHIDPQTAQLIFAGVAALALLLQAIVLLAIFFGIRKAISTLREDFEDIRTSVTPFVKDAHQVFTRVAPKIEETTADVAALTHTLRAQSEDLKVASAEIIEKARRQATRLDSMATNVLDTADRAGAFVNEAVSKPMRQLNGILASIRAVVESLRTPEPAARTRTNHKPGDPEMFV